MTQHHYHRPRRRDSTSSGEASASDPDSGTSRSTASESASTASTRDSESRRHRRGKSWDSDEGSYESSVRDPPLSVQAERRAYWAFLREQTDGDDENDDDDERRGRAARLLWSGTAGLVLLVALVVAGVWTRQRAVKSDSGGAGQSGADPTTTSAETEPYSASRITHLGGQGSGVQPASTRRTGAASSRSSSSSGKGGASSASSSSRTPSPASSSGPSTSNAGPYKLTIAYEGETFFDGWTFWDKADPTHVRPRVLSLRVKRTAL